MPQAAACAQCDKKDCSAVVIVPAVPDDLKKFDLARQRLELVCPACRRSFSVLIPNFEYRDVTDEELLRGFIEESAH